MPRKKVKRSTAPNKNAKLETQDITSLIREIKQLENRKQQLEEEIQQGENCVRVTDTKSDIQSLKEAANRWTDNIFAVKSWCKKKFMIEDKTLNKQFGIPENLDYIP